MELIVFAEEAFPGWKGVPSAEDLGLRNERGKEGTHGIHIHPFTRVTAEEEEPRKEWWA